MDFKYPLSVTRQAFKSSLIERNIHGQTLAGRRRVRSDSWNSSTSHSTAESATVTAVFRSLHYSDAIFRRKAPNFGEGIVATPTEEKI
ncbi:hypothetical protein AVEN_105957-1 [Araneus ventricosus]|uniref:Uncharacterized protein n=1 Tax=Araneus ventricosus TaxID=182803 RepID=A0A4Y2DYN5_ARAVE|nr:hypothetical protein AVEN_105957-1 [Araneus ventricosus]